MLNTPILLESYEEVNLKQIIYEDKILIVDNFFKNLSWLDEVTKGVTRKINENEEIISLPRKIRISLLEEISKIIPKAYFISDSGWIRKTYFKNGKIQPESCKPHMDAPYLVVSLCLSEKSSLIENEGTEFLKHKEFKFNKVYSSKNEKLFNRIYEKHRFIDDKWTIWNKEKLKYNRAFIYSGSLIHRMPKISESLKAPRVMQFFIFRLGEDDYRELLNE